MALLMDLILTARELGLASSHHHIAGIMKLSFSLKAKKDTAPAKPPPPKPALFSGDDAETEEPAVPVSVPYNVEASKAMQKRIEQEKAVDPSVYDYDEVWDRMQEVKEKQKAAKAIEAMERKVKSRVPHRVGWMLTSDTLK
jgi:coiled-coil domain-containing protein 55